MAGSGVVGGKHGRTDDDGRGGDGCLDVDADVRVDVGKGGGGSSTFAEGDPAKAGNADVCNGLDLSTEGRGRVGDVNGGGREPGLGGELVFGV